MGSPSGDSLPIQEFRGIPCAYDLIATVIHLAFVRHTFMI